MPKRDKKSRKRATQSSAEGSGGQAASSRHATEHKRQRAEPKTGGVRVLRPILRAVLIFGVCIVAYYAFEATALFQERLFPAYLRWNAGVATVVLNVIGENASVQGTAIVSPGFAIEIRRGCDAVEPSALYIAAVIALPVLIWKRLAGIVVGTALLMFFNQVRIVSLYYVGVHWPGAFEPMHLDVWQAVFILLVVVLWALWAAWARRPTPVAQRADT